MSAGHNIAKKVLARLRQRREQLGLSQAALAEAVGVAASYVGLLERGERVPSLDVLAQLAAALDLELANLFADSANTKAEFPEVVRIRTMLSRWPAKQRGAAVRVLTEMDRIVRR